MTPEEAFKQRKIDEAMTSLSDLFPRTWRTFYLRCIEEGFTKDESLSLVKTYILSNCPYGVHLHKD